MMQSPLMLTAVLPVTFAYSAYFVVLILYSKVTLVVLLRSCCAQGMYANSRSSVSDRSFFTICSGSARAGVTLGVLSLIA